MSKSSDEDKKGIVELPKKDFDKNNPTYLKMEAITQAIGDKAAPKVIYAEEYTDRKFLDELKQNNANPEKPKMVWVFGDNDRDKNEANTKPTELRKATGNQAGALKDMTYAEYGVVAEGIVTTKHTTDGDLSKSFKESIEKLYDRAAEKPSVTFIVPAEFDKDGKMTKINIGTGIAADSLDEESQKRMQAALVKVFQNISEGKREAAPDIQLEHGQTKVREEPQKPKEEPKRAQDTVTQDTVTQDTVTQDTIKKEEPQLQQNLKKEQGPKPSMSLPHPRENAAPQFIPRSQELIEAKAKADKATLKPHKKTTGANIGLIIAGSMIALAGGPIGMAIGGAMIAAAVGKAVYDNNKVKKQTKAIENYQKLEGQHQNAAREQVFKERQQQQQVGRGREEQPQQSSEMKQMQQTLKEMTAQLKELREENQKLNEKLEKATKQPQPEQKQQDGVKPEEKSPEGKAWVKASPTKPKEQEASQKATIKKSEINDLENKIPQKIPPLASSVAKRDTLEEDSNAVADKMKKNLGKKVTIGENRSKNTPSTPNKTQTNSKGPVVG